MIQNYVMETNTKTKSLHTEMNLIKEKHSADSLHKEKIAATTVIIITGIFFSTFLFLVKISWVNIDWKIPLIPLMIALQIIFLLSALKNRYKKL
jgi:hypothetical protein